jgi:hypothetical protein
MAPAFLILAAAAAAQLAAVPAVRAQSPFALVNLGADVRSDDARIAGRGGWGLAEQDTLNPAFKNPAGLAGLRTVTLLLSGYAESNRSTTPEAARTTRRVFTPNVRGAIPVAGGRLALTTGFHAKRATQYTSVIERSLIFEGEPLTYDEEFVREGTQFDIPVALAWRARPWLSLSAGLNLVRGNTREILNEFFDLDADGNGMADFLVPSRIQEDEYEGTSATFGLHLRPHARLRLGAVVTPAHGVEVKRTVQIEGVAAKADSSFQLDWPESWAVGADYRLGERWRCGLDYEVRGFSGFDGRDDWEADMVDEWILGFGLERARGHARRGMWGNLPLRLGATLRRWGYRVGGEEVRELRIAVGTGFPFRRNTGNLDVAVSHGWVGDMDENGSQDRVWRLTVSVSGL